MSSVELVKASKVEPDVDGEENESLVDKFISSEEDLIPALICHQLILLPKKTVQQHRNRYQKNVS